MKAFGVFTFVILSSSALSAGELSVPPEQVSQAARDELLIIERLKSLRIATEKLPSNWQAKNVKTAQNGILTKTTLLQEIENLELTAADRWSVILENAARMNIQGFSSTKSSESKRAAQIGAVDEDRLAKIYRDRMKELPRIHSDINRRLDEYNARLKDGILMNLASRIIAQP